MSAAAPAPVCETPPLPLLAGERPPVAGAVKIEVLDDGSGHHHSARAKARKAALDILYAAELTGRDALDLLEAEPAVRDYTKQIVEGVYYRQLAIDQRISRAAADDWTPGRMPAVDRAIARIAVWEIDQAGLAPAVVISQALELADEYSTDKSAAFLNSLLGRVAAAPGDQLDDDTIFAPLPDDRSDDQLDEDIVFALSEDDHLSPDDQLIGTAAFPRGVNDRSGEATCFAPSAEDLPAETDGPVVGWADSVVMPAAQPAQEAFDE